MVVIPNILHILALNVNVMFSFTVLSKLFTFTRAFISKIALLWIHNKANFPVKRHFRCHYQNESNVEAFIHPKNLHKI